MAWIGVDEVGRGCLWGPVTAAAVLLPDAPPDDDPLWHAIRDSKKVSEKQRPRLAAYIRRVALAVGVGWASVEEVDQVNILQATMRAMHRALDEVWRTAPPDVLARVSGIHVDGTYFVPYMPPGRDADAVDHTCVPHGDAEVRAIAAASVVAKVARDAHVAAAAAERPELAPYDLAKNKGYGTPAHLAALRTHGAQDGHRRSFNPVYVAAIRPFP